MKEDARDYPPLLTKLIFNPISGAPGVAPINLLEIINELQNWNLVPEVHLVGPDQDLTEVVREALGRGIQLFAVSGGDGTIDTVASALIDKGAVLGIIPTGTQNNVALSLGIPKDIPGAVALLRQGRSQRLDVGLATCEGTQRAFLEACSVGLLSALFSAADDIQHGNLARIGDFLATLVAFPPAEIQLMLDDQQEISTQGHVVLIGNMPFIGPHYQIASAESYQDGLLDVVVFANLSKLDLMGTVVQTAGGMPEDPRVRRFTVHSVRVNTNPAMPVLTDGFPLGEGPLHIEVRPAAIMVKAGKPGGTGRLNFPAAGK